MEDKVKIATDYQSALRREKLALLGIPASRKIIWEGIGTLVREGRLRSVKRVVLSEALRILDESPGSTDEFVLTIPLSLDTWCAARAAAVEDTSVEFTAWKSAKGDVDALQLEIVSEYAWLVQVVVAQHFPSAPYAEDLFGEGLIGLVRGLETFDPSKGKHLKAHLQGWILGQMIAFARETEERKARDAAPPTETEQSPTGSGKSIRFGQKSTTSVATSGEGEGSYLLSMDASAMNGFEEGMPLSLHDTLYVEEARTPFTKAESQILMERLYEAAKTRPAYARLSLGLANPVSNQPSGPCVPLSLGLEQLDALARAVIEKEAK